MKNGGYGRISDVPWSGRKWRGKHGRLGLGATSEAGSDAMAMAAFVGAGRHHRAPAQDLAIARARERARNGRLNEEQILRCSGWSGSVSR